jgi:predicted  nucleic acid-binding Zn-ribbon protein
MNKFLLLVLMLSLAACDTKKEERNALHLELDERSNALASVERKIQDVEATRKNVAAMLDSAKEALSKNDANVKENKNSLASYVLRHKSAVAAVAASSAGVYSVLSDNLDEQERSAALVSGLLGAGYCLLIADDGECSDATAQVTYYGGQIAYYKSEAIKDERQIREYQARLADIERQMAPFLAERTTLSSKVAALGRQIEALTCRDCL